MAYQHINAKKRHTLMYLLQMGLSYREIGRRLDRHHTSIVREVERNKRVFGSYWNEFAQVQAEKRKEKPRHTRKASNLDLADYVISKLKEDWSPEAISGRLKVDFPRTKSMRISCEGIYQWVYRDYSNGHGRNTDHSVPPVQIRTCATNAYGSYFEYLARKRISG